MKGFKISPLHRNFKMPVIHKVKLKKRYYRTILIVSAGAIWIVHEYHPHYEMHAAFLTNLLFAIEDQVIDG